MTADTFANSCLNVLETIFAADAMSTGMLIQYILAPPPPMPDDDDQGFSQGGPLETMRPLGAIVASNVAEVCAKIMDGSAMNLQGSNAVFRSDVETAERCANVLALVFWQQEAYIETVYGPTSCHSLLACYLTMVRLAFGDGAGFDYIVLLADAGMYGSVSLLVIYFTFCGICFSIF
jgi:hypothetical protein